MNEAIVKPLNKVKNKSASKLSNCINNSRTTKALKILNTFALKNNPAFPFIFNLNDDVSAIYSFADNYKGRSYNALYSSRIAPYGLYSFPHTSLAFRLSNDIQGYYYYIHIDLIFKIKNRKLIYYMFKLSNEEEKGHTYSLPIEEDKKLKIVAAILSKSFHIAHKPAIYDL